MGPFLHQRRRDVATQHVVDWQESNLLHGGPLWRHAILIQPAVDRRPTRQHRVTRFRLAIPALSVMRLHQRCDESLCRAEVQVNTQSSSAAGR
jgi:hypothetical protein